MDSKANDKFPQKTEDPEEKTGVQMEAEVGRTWPPGSWEGKEDILFPRARHVGIEAQPTP